jgi:hypothetical protein
MIVGRLNSRPDYGARLLMGMPAKTLRDMARGMGIDPYSVPMNLWNFNRTAPYHLGQMHMGHVKERSVD